MPYFVFIIIAVILSIILAFIRPVRLNLTKEERNDINAAVGWVLIIYGLIMAFSLTIFYQRYIAIRDTFINQVTNLQITYRIFDALSRSDDAEIVKDSTTVIESMRDYLDTIFTDLIPDLEQGKYSKSSETAYKKMDDEIIKFVGEHPSIPYNNALLLRLSTDQVIKRLVDEISVGKYYIEILSFLFIFILIPLWYSSLPEWKTQLVIDLCVLIILLTVIYLCTILNNPFMKSRVSIKFSAYEDLLKEVNASLYKLEGR
jgi:hypothetical protein